MSCNTKFICVGGKAGSGKDHCVSVLTRFLEASGKIIFQTAFADHLKQQCCNVTGVPLHMWHMPSEIKQKDNSALRVVNGNDKYFVSWCVDNKHSVDVPRSMRWWMQHYSDYKKAQHGDNYYIDYVVDNIQDVLVTSKPDYVILTDGRYARELSSIFDIAHNVYDSAVLEGFAAVYINNPDNVVGVIPENIILGEQQAHTSEQLTQEAFQYVILNTYSTREEAILGQWLDILGDK